MSPRATVLIPTHDHGPLLLHSVGTVLRQTVDDIEVFIVGDGATDPTREAALTLEKSDDRVRFFDNPKGPNRGEILRHAALEQATGHIVCYLCDDDLWLPDHLEAMSALLAGADFAHTLPFHISTDGSLFTYNGDLGVPYFRRYILEGSNFIPYSAGGHTLALYQRSEGWQTSPPGAFTDLTMWQRLLRVPGCRAVSGTRPTLLHFPTSVRTDWSLDRRIEEVERWEGMAASPSWRDSLTTSLLDDMARARARVTADMDAAEKEIERLRWDLTAIQGTRTWRWRDRLLGAPLIGALLRGAASARARR